MSRALASPARCPSRDWGNRTRYGSRSDPPGDLRGEPVACSRGEPEADSQGNPVTDRIDECRNQPAGHSPSHSPAEPVAGFPSELRPDPSIEPPDDPSNESPVESEDEPEGDLWNPREGSTL